MVKLSNCHGSNLLNYLRQKDIDFEIEQYNYLSARDLEVENTRGNVVYEDNVTLMSNPDYYCEVKFKDNNYELNYIHREQNKYADKPLWRTKFVFQGKTVYALNYTKKSSLQRAVTMMESHIRTSLGL